MRFVGITILLGLKVVLLWSNCHCEWKVTLQGHNVALLAKESDSMTALRLFAPEVSPSPPRDAYASDNLRQAYELHFTGSLVGKAPATKNEYEKALDHWERFTDNPRICDVNDEVFEAFRKAAFDEDEYSAATINKWGRHLQAIFNRLGPKCSRNKKGKSILREVPFYEPLPEVDPDPVRILDSALNAFYHACKVAEWPSFSRTGVPSSLLWRTAEVLAVTYGPRRSDLFGLKWTQMDFENNQIGFRAKKTGKWHHFPMTPIVRAHLLEIKTDREYVLPITTSHHYLYRQLQEIQHEAKIKRPDGSYYDFRNFRQTCASRSDSHIPGTASIILGHSISSVTHDNYLGRQAYEAAARCLNTIAMPSAFYEILERHQRVEDTCNYNTGSD